MVKFRLDALLELRQLVVHETQHGLAVQSIIETGFLNKLAGLLIEGTLVVERGLAVQFPFKKIIDGEIVVVISRMCTFGESIQLLATTAASAS